MKIARSVRIEFNDKTGFFEIQSNADHSCETLHLSLEEARSVIEQLPEVVQGAVTLARIDEHKEAR